MKRSVVETVIYGLLSESLNIINTITMEVPRLTEDGSIGGVDYDFVMNHVPEDYEMSARVHPTDCPRINLPSRQRDRRVFSTSKRKLFPFSPNGSQRV